jgi:hypothetical protein
MVPCASAMLFNEVVTCSFPDLKSDSPKISPQKI